MNRILEFITSFRRHSFKWLLLAVVFGFLIYLLLPSAYGDQLPQRNLMLSDNQVSVYATYQLGFTIPNSEMLGSIKLQICSNNPIIGEPCTIPTGFDISGSILSSQSGQTGFNILSGETDSYDIVLTRVPTTASPEYVTYTFQNVMNPSIVGPYYGRLQTFATSDASGPATDSGGIAFDISNPIQLSTKVPPYLYFCAGITISPYDCSTASGDYLNFGNLSSTATNSAQTQLITATNADTGYSMDVFGTTMTSGNNIINAMSSADVSRPGISQFGLNLVANQTPLIGQNPIGPGVAYPEAAYSQPNWFKFLSGDTIATANQPTDYTEFTVSYIVNVAKNQPVGVYVTSLTFLCLANF
jgi:hypothetical protein